MAETSQLKKNQPIDFGDDDPFAELTKIMGFDPREAVKRPEPPRAEAPAARQAAPAAPARPQQAAPAPRSYATPTAAPTRRDTYAAPALNDDFGIDLEREMLGDVDPQQPAPQPRPAPQAAQQQPARRTDAPRAFTRASWTPPARPEDDLDRALSEQLSQDLDLDAPAAAPSAWAPRPPHNDVPDFARQQSYDEPRRHETAYAGHHSGHAAPDAADYRAGALAEVDMDFGSDFDQGADLDHGGYAEPDTRHAAPVSHGDTASDLEDELNALLGNTIPRAKVDLSTPAPAEPAERWSPRSTYVARPERAERPVVADRYRELVADEPPAPVGRALPARKDVDLDHLLDVMAIEAQSPEPVAQLSDLPDYDHSPLHIPTAPAPRRAAAPAFPEPAPRAPQAARGFAPDVATVDVPESAVAYADDLDIPEVAYHEPEPVRPAYDDFDAGYAAPYAARSGDQDFAPRRADQAGAASSRVDFDADFDALYRQVREAAGVPAYAAAEAPAYASSAPIADKPGTQAYFDEDQDTFDEDVELHSHAAETTAPASRRGLMIAAVVGGVALLGGVGAFALSFGGGSSETSVPVVVQAEDGPVKVKPDDPGGTSVPNQDNKVFETMTGGQTATANPSQETLVSTSEEPIDLRTTAEDTDGLTLAPKGEDRVEMTPDASSTTTSDEIIAVPPRKVKTMIVKPDGTLVPREDPMPAAAAPALAPAVDVDPDESGQIDVAEAAPLVPVAEETDEATTATTAAAPAVEEAPAQVALAPAADAAATATAASGAWSMQIASQPSAEAAQSTYEDLARRYAGVIGGRAVNIVKADVTGKGTFWRVRILADTKNDAVRLCDTYKAAGGNCFVTR
ncbi:MAG: SPOR domain-containing protein [Rhizobiaceae bacterium]|nr:SPOR domain-containing protein [Rhizobiaceae bacterium]